MPHSGYHRSRFPLRGKQNKKGTAGAGTIRRKVVRRGGKEYAYWEARYTTGFDPGTGKQKQRSITAKTQKEAAQKLRQATAELDRGIYQEPCKMQLGKWLDIWQADYLGGAKPRTKEGVPPLSAKTIKLIHGILHKALQQAVAIGYLRFNPSDACALPRVIKKELRPPGVLSPP